MPIDQTIIQIIKGMLPQLVLLCVVSGAVGALISNILFGWLDGLFEKAAMKRRAQNWKARQDMAKADQGAQPRGDGVVGRARETHSDSAA